MRSPVRASILPNCGGRGEILVPTATIGVVRSHQSTVAGVYQAVKGQARKSSVKNTQAVDLES